MWKSTKMHRKSKRKTLTCSSQVAGREDDAAKSAAATVLSKDGAGVVGVVSGCEGAGAFTGEATRPGEAAASRRGLVTSSASLRVKQMMRHTRGGKAAKSEISRKTKDVSFVIITKRGNAAGSPEHDVTRSRCGWHRAQRKGLQRRSSLVWWRMGSGVILQISILGRRT